MARGRPSKLDPAMIARLTEALMAGASRVRAARAAGIEPRTLRLWCHLGKAQPDGPYHELEQAVTAAEAEGRLPPEVKLANRITEAESWVPLPEPPGGWTRFDRPPAEARERNGRLFAPLPEYRPVERSGPPVRANFRGTVGQRL